MQPQGWALQEHPPIKHPPAPCKHRLQRHLQAPQHPNPVHLRHLEIGLAIETRCSHITGPVNTARGQKYQVAGEGLICFHFYDVSNLEKRKRLHKKPSQLLLDGYGFHFPQSLREVTSAKREMRAQEVDRCPSITPQPDGSVQPSTNWSTHVAQLVFISLLNLDGAKDSVLV